MPKKLTAGVIAVIVTCVVLLVAILVVVIIMILEDAKTKKSHPTAIFGEDLTYVWAINYTPPGTTIQGMRLALSTTRPPTAVLNSNPFLIVSTTPGEAKIPVYEYERVPNVSLERGFHYGTQPVPPAGFSLPTNSQGQPIAFCYIYSAPIVENVAMKPVYIFTSAFSDINSSFINFDTRVTWLIDVLTNTLAFTSLNFHQFSRKGSETVFGYSIPLELVTE